MQIQQGVVRYKDRSDLICNYGITEDGKQYYFLDNKPLSNGNIIASTALVEAVDPTVKATHAGVITRDGKVVIPLENKMIKNLGNNILLVERAVPISKNVLESIGLKNIPDAATKLVTTPATIKDRLMLKMENEGRFVFNDQFSEASIFDYDGKNLINDEYFSFIGMNSKKIYFSKNTVDSEIVEYSIFPEKVVAENNQENIKVEEVAKEVGGKLEDTINEKMTYKATAVEPPLVGKHMPTAPAPVAPPVVPPVPPTPVVPPVPPVPAPVAPVAPPKEEPALPVEPVAPAKPVEATPIAPPVPEVKPPVEEVKPPVEVAPIAPPVVPPVTPEPVAPETIAPPVEEAKEEVPVTVEEEKTIEIPIVPEVEEEKEEKPAEKEEAVEEVKEENEDNLLDNISVDEPTGKLLDAEDVAKVVGEVEKEEKPVEEVENTDNNQDLEISFAKDLEEKEEDKNIEEEKDLDREEEEEIPMRDFDHEDYNTDFSDRDLFGDSLLNLDRIDMDYEEERLSKNMNIIDDVTKSMSNLISLNKKQNNKILDYEKSIARLRRSGNDLSKKNRSLEDEIRFLNNKIRNYETIVSKLENRNHELDDRIEEQTKKIKDQEKEISSLKPSATSKEELLKLIADANSLVDEDSMDFRRSA